MKLEKVRKICLSLPHAAESVKWDDNLVFTVDSKMFAVAALEPGPLWISFKCSPDDFADLLERPGIVPAPYLARAQWVALEGPQAMPPRELEARLRQAYAIVFAKLPKKRQVELAAAPQ